MKTFRLRSTCEVAACRRVDVFLIKSAPAVLTRRQAALIFIFECYINSELNCAVRHNFTQNRRFSSLPRRNAMKPGHLHPKKRSLAYEVATFHSACEVVPLSLHSFFREGLNLQLLRLQVKETCKHGSNTQVKQQKFLLSAAHPGATNFSTKTILFSAPAARGGKMARDV